MKSTKPLKNNTPNKSSLSRILSSLNLIGAVIEARICEACKWDDDDVEYFCRHTDEIPEKEKIVINAIISSELSKRYRAAPAIPVKGQLTPGKRGIAVRRQICAA